MQSSVLWVQDLWASHQRLPGARAISAGGAVQVICVCLSGLRLVARALLPITGSISVCDGGCGGCSSGFGWKERNLVGGSTEF
uniref:Uncharacterized protein n=1 Tax=Romanomermis culicivorax TaxID=13658 RepID=A0A915KXE1_ROMCU